MTGSLAVIMASLAGASALAIPDRRGQVLASPFGVQETVRRIEEAAHRHGLPVLASVDRTNPQQIRWVVVLGSAEGGTPVQMDASADTPAVPLAVHVERGPDGGTWVCLPDLAAATRVDEPDSDWPDSVVDELAGLPRLIEEALVGGTDRLPA
jgi:hypothetical protein